MKSSVLFFTFFVLLSINLVGQDYFEDIEGSGFSVLSGKNGTMLSTRLNVGDNSIKLNFYQQYPQKGRKIDPLNVPKNLYDIGWGLSVKGKSEDGIGLLFTSGAFAPGFNGSGYLSLRDIIDTKGQSSWWILLLSGGYTISNLNLYHPDAAFNKQLTDTIFQGYNLGLSWSYLFPVNKSRDNIIVGASAGFNRVNNYGNLSKVVIKDTKTITDTTGTARDVTPSKHNGAIYAKGAYKEYNTLKLRVSMAYIPSFLNNRVAFMVYPSINYSMIFAPVYNTGIGIQFLKEGAPTVSIGGIFVEFNDMTNAQGSTDGFVKRTLTIGLTGSLNLLVSK